MGNQPKFKQTRSVAQQSKQIIDYSQKCQSFDDYYGNRKKISILEAHGEWIKNSYEEGQNQKGIVNFGTSVNSIIPKTTLNYLPSWLTEKDCAYADPLGRDPQFNEYVCKNTKFSHNQTIIYNSVNFAISQFCHQYSNIHFIGNQSYINLILDHSKGKNVSPQNANIIITVSQPLETLKDVAKKFPEKIKLFFIQDQQKMIQFFTQKNNNQIFVYQHSLKAQLKFGVVHTCNKQIISKLYSKWNFGPLSNVIRKASITPQLQIKIEDSSTTHIRKMIQIDSGVIIEQNNIFLTIGATGALDFLSRVIFNGGNLCIDCPYYAGFDYDFSYSGVKIVRKYMFDDRKMLDRIKEAHSQGSVGYVICNPNNPIGCILQPKQVTEICEWAKGYPKFHLIFDEMYINTCRDKQTLSSASYALKSQNIHTVRGFAKDYGLCGFKVGFAISSNKNVKTKYQQWKNIISHHPFIISVINDMLVKSDHGQKIIVYGKQLLRNHYKILFQILNTIGLSYIRPEAGCFIFGDFKKFMRRPSLDEENLLWKKMFYKYRVNLANGTDYHMPDIGYFRICPITYESIMKMGLSRIIAAIRDINLEQKD